MRILYHGHALLRMHQRGVTEDHVRQVLEAPDTTLPADHDRTRYIADVDDAKRLSVVAIIRRINDTHFIVYTAYFHDQEAGE